MKRLFVAISLPVEIKQAIFQAVRWMDTYSESVRVIPVENYHLTLKFLGAVPEEGITSLEAVLSEVARRVHSFPLHLEKCGVFPEKGHPSVFWIGVEPAPELETLFNDCEEVLAGLGYTRETRAFHPHITLARTGTNHAPAEFLKEWNAMKVFPIPTYFQVDELTLYESIAGPSGPVYQVLKREKFGKIV